MSTEHTPGRLESKTHTYGIADTGDYDSIFEIWGGEKVIAWFGGEDTDEANARRLVACWNACEGIETYALELMTGDLSIKQQITATGSAKPPKPTSKAVEYRRQRDELLAALKEARRWIGDGECSDGLAREHWTQEYRAAVDRIDAAIAKVTGEQT